jgi:hypothetical protein
MYYELKEAHPNKTQKEFIPWIAREYPGVCLRALKPLLAVWVWLCEGGEKEITRI